MRLSPTILALILIGCTRSVSAITPYDPPDPPGFKSSDRPVPQYQVWADGTLSWDFATETLAFIPARAADAHFDVWPMLNPPRCLDCVALHVLSHDKVQKLLTVEVILRNPTGLSGWFVRGLVIPADPSRPELLDPDGWWRPADLPDTALPAPFMIFAGDQPDMEFGPGESHSATYHFHYTELSDFVSCSYRVIVRFPKSPGEVNFIGDEEIHGAYSTGGGFVSLRADMRADIDAPAVTMTATKALEGILGAPVNMRHESADTYLGWLCGEVTSADTADLWVIAEMSGVEHELSYCIEIPILDVVPQPNREFPIVGPGGAVFVDQLTTGMTPEQTEFMATHCVGSQKLVKTLADSIRAYNPDFIVLQYHLAFGAGDLANIYGNDWVTNWEFENAQEDFFEHRSWSTQPHQRVLQQDWNWYLTDPTSDWVNYFIGNTIERMDPLGDQFDGVFADSASQPWNTDPEKWWEGSDDPHDMFNYWTPKTQSFFDTVSHAYHTLPTYCYLIPNAGSYVTTISDITYYQCDGVMIEGFCHWGPGSYFTEEDWRLQMSRARLLAIMDRIILAQTDVDVEDTIDRSFVHGSYMLLLDNYTYLNMLGPWGLQPQWWPEYHWNPGPAMEDWMTINDLQDAGGCYVRHYENGIVIVNPSGETRYYTTTKMYSHSMFAEGGLLPPDGIPTGVATGPLIDPGVQEILPYSAWLGIG